LRITVCITDIYIDRLRAKGIDTYRVQPLEMWQIYDDLIRYV